MRSLLAGLMFLADLLLSPSPASSAATEVSRDPTTLTAGRNVITGNSIVKYAGYARGEWIRVTLDYSATGNVVFGGLSPRRPISFSPYPAVAGEVANLSGTPAPGHAATAGSVTLDIRFNTLNRTAAGTESGAVTLNLALGVDKDCNLATGDPDGVDGTATLRAHISVSTGPE